MLINNSFKAASSSPPRNQDNGSGPRSEEVHTEEKLPSWNQVGPSDFSDLASPICVKFEAQTAPNSLISLFTPLHCVLLILVIPEQTEIRDKAPARLQEYLRLQCTLPEHCTVALFGFRSCVAQHAVKVSKLKLH